MVSLDLSYRYTQTNPVSSFNSNFADDIRIFSDEYGKIMVINSDFPGFVFESQSTPSCYLQGTKILCFDTNNNIHYHKKIQDLNVGELVYTNDGYKSIKFIGYNKFNYNNHPNIIYKLPKNSISINQPYEDLFVLHWHSLIYKNINDIDLYKNIDSYNENTYNMINKIPNYYKLLSRDHNKCVLVDYDELNKLNLIDQNDEIIYYNIVVDTIETDVNSNSVIYANGVLSETITKMSIDKYNSLYLK